MRRREFISLLGAAAAGWPFAARAQQSKLWRVGIITGGIRSPAYDGFLQGMRDLGYRAGTDYVAEWRIADGRYSQFPVFADELVRLKVDVIFVGTAAAVNPVRDVATRIPIVMGYSTDPIGNGFVKSLDHPGGNVTGLASSGTDTSATQLDLLATAIPGLKRVALLQNPDNPNYAPVLKNTQVASVQAGIDLIAVDVHNPQDIDDIFTALEEKGVQAIKVTSDPLFLVQQRRLAELALKSRLLSVFSDRDYVQAGGLMSYGESLKDFYRRAATFVDRIFKGAKPGDLPIEQPTKQSLVINRRTAESLGLTLPASLLARADEVIE